MSGDKTIVLEADELMALKIHLAQTPIIEFRDEDEMLLLYKVFNKLREAQKKQ